MSDINLDFCEQFMGAKSDYDSFSQAIKLAKQYNAEEKSIQSLIFTKQQLKHDCAENNKKLLKQMTLARNVANLKDSWFAVRYVDDKGDSHVIVDPVIEKDLYMIQRDGRRERELTRNDVDTLLPSIQDELALEVYKQEITRKAYQLVYDYTGVEVLKEEGAKALVSSHARLRWVQRKLGITNEQEAIEYQRTHFKQVEKEILEGFEDAQLVWTGRDGIKYYFDSSNIMYVVGDDQTIITLYEEDFGFTKEINRQIVFQQIEVVKKSAEELDQANESHQEVVRDVENELTNINGDIRILEAKIDHLTSKKGKLLSTREESNKALKLSENRFCAESDKLFKKWDT